MGLEKGEKGSHLWRMELSGPCGSLWRVQRIGVEPTPAIRLNGRLMRSETVYGAFGAHVLLLSTAIGDAGIEFHASYVGHERTDAQVAELLIAPGERRA